MYYVFNYIPALVLGLIAITHFKISSEAFLWSSFIGLPIYLLIVNLVYLQRKKRSLKGWGVSVINVIIELLLNIIISMIRLKILYGTFFADVPRQLFYLRFFIPFVIVLIGFILYYFIGNQKKR